MFVVRERVYADPKISKFHLIAVSFVYFLTVSTTGWPRLTTRRKYPFSVRNMTVFLLGVTTYEGRSESKERFAIQPT